MTAKETTISDTEVEAIRLLNEVFEAITGYHLITPMSAPMAKSKTRFGGVIATTWVHRTQAFMTANKNKAGIS